MLKKNTDPENRQINPVFKGFNAPPPQFPGCSLCHSPHILEISWKSIHPFVHNVANRHIAAPRWETVKQSSHAWNSLFNYFLCRAKNPFIRFFTIVLTITDSQNRKIYPEFKGLITTIPVRSTVNSPHKGQSRGASMFSLISAWINGWVNNGKASGLRRLRPHYDLTVMGCCVTMLNDW